ncbi:MAG TPA: hypothetical protein VLU94_00095 [Candidatus Nitrosotalea sp.]|nr:hypothetical protein [Candidatus Nitrosotalea sp.]
MSHFGLDPSSVMERIRVLGAPVTVPSLSQSIVTGGLGFAAVGLASFAVWAWGGHWLVDRFGELALYSACAAVLIGGGGAVFSPLVIGPGRLCRFFGLFALAMFLYAGVWTGSYFSMRKMSGEILGSLVAPAIMGMTFANAFAAPGMVRKVVTALLISHGFGYFSGQLFYREFQGLPGILLWGVDYGFCFGAGIGYTIYYCQNDIRCRLEEISKGSSHNSRI